MSIKDKTICCPEFDPKTLDNKTHIWQDKLFLKDDVRQFLHIPLNMGQVVTRMWSKIELFKANPADKDFLMLCYDPSPWKSEIYMTVTKDIPTGTTVKISGTFFSKVFDGPYQDVPKWIKATDEILKSKNQVALKYYFYYAYCPKCSQKYGHNYCVAFAQISP